MNSTRSSRAERGAAWRGGEPLDPHELLEICILREAIEPTLTGLVLRQHESVRRMWMR